MNLQPTIPSALWNAVQSAYEAENYSHAILEATYLISGVLRERAGVDGDGASLVGQALAGDDPKLKLNAFQSESERNEQKGFEQMLRGIYLGIRNPRSHEQTTDDKETADAIIHFLGYIIKRLNSSKAEFTIDGFLARVLDSEFVESVRYAELLVAEVPKLRLSDCLIKVYRERKKIELRKLRHLIPALLSALTPPQLAAYLNVVSEELRTATDDPTIRTSLQMLTAEVWPSISELPRLRIENKLVQGIRQGEVLASGKTTQPLATWSNTFLKAFTTRSETANALISRLDDQDPDARHYVAKYFMRNLPEVMSTASQKTRCIRAIVSAVDDDDANVRSNLIGAVLSYPVDWQMELAEELKQLTDEENPAVHLADGSPFLSAPAKDEFDDDIPF
ncbi:TIGR02391 family protein [Janthinobacterium sp. J1-1]|uniref:TIGR02391 family protein n=1 Tax=Janthinobacterium sp. J1-1 TaxID=3065910 RepID=UPI002810F8EE|nr:TIGR02391 family protein [Janthinobacterium sp. J1-1]